MVLYRTLLEFHSVTDNKKVTVNTVLITDAPPRQRVDNHEPKQSSRVILLAAYNEFCDIRVLISRQFNDSLPHYLCDDGLVARVKQECQDVPQSVHELVRSWNEQLLLVPTPLVVRLQQHA